MESWAFWGKFDPSGGSPAIHPLADHCIDVAVTFRQLAALPAFRSRLASEASSSPTDVQLDRLAVIAFAHDIGKCNWGFQAKRLGQSHATTGHVAEGAALLLVDEIRALWPTAFAELLCEAAEWFDNPPDGMCRMLLAAISHHGRPVSFADVQRDRDPLRWWRPNGDVDPMSGLTDLTIAARRAFPAAFEGAPPLAVPVSLQQRFAGLVMLADWIGSDTRFFPYSVDPRQDRHAFAAGQAERALTAIGLAKTNRGVRGSFEAVFAGRRPTPLQQLLDVGLHCDDDSRILLVESETGSGKTEAALAWFLRLYVSGLVDSLYFALPTRVAARELYSRVRQTIDAAFPDPSLRPGPVLLAAPGYVRVDGETPLPSPEGRLWEDDTDARRRERQWVAAHPKRFLAAPVAVGTIDQTLLSVLKVKHALLRSVCLDRSLLIVDEVHASDPYMRQLLHALLEGHIGRGGHAMLLSATLGDSAASSLLNASPRTLGDAKRVPYPAVRTRSRVHSIQSVGKSKRVAIEWAPGLEETVVLPSIADALTRGARVLVVCNTVRRANALLRSVEAAAAVPASALFRVGDTVCPHHGRFARAHREKMDEAVSARLGTGSIDAPLLLVGTQTLEQSLDIDADWLVTDLCPMDVLLQRIGRLHRHRRAHRPIGFDQPRVLIRAPAELELARWLNGRGDLRAPAGLGTVYTDGRVLQQTLQVLGERTHIDLPRENRDLIEDATHPEALMALPPIWSKHADVVEGRVLAETRAAITGTAVDLPFGELTYGAPDEVLTTRLGVNNWRLVLAHPMSLPFGITVTEIDLPGHMAPKGEPPPERVTPEPTEGGFVFAIGASRYRYTRFGLERDDDA